MKYLKDFKTNTQYDNEFLINQGYLILTNFIDEGGDIFCNSIGDGFKITLNSNAKGSVNNPNSIYWNIIREQILFFIEWLESKFKIDRILIREKSYDLFQEIPISYLKSYIHDNKKPDSNTFRIKGKSRQKFVNINCMKIFLSNPNSK